MQLNCWHTLECLNDVYKARSLPQTDFCHYVELRCLRGNLFLLLSAFKCDPVKYNLLVFVVDVSCLLLFIICFSLPTVKQIVTAGIIKLHWTLNSPVLFCNLFRFDSWDCQHVGHPSHHCHSGRSQTSQGDAGWIRYDRTPGQPRQGSSIILWGQSLRIYLIYVSIFFFLIFLKSKREAMMFYPTNPTEEYGLFAIRLGKYKAHFYTEGTVGFISTFCLAVSPCFWLRPFVH